MGLRGEMQMNATLCTGLAAVLAGMCSISFIYFGFYLIPAANRDERFRPLVYLCFFSSAWSFCYVLYFLSRDASAQEFWQRFTFAGQFAFAFLLWFVIRYSDPIRSRIAQIIPASILWIPPFIGSYIGITENAVVRDFPSGFWFLYAQIQTSIYNLASMILLIVYHSRQKTNKGRMQVYILTSSGFVLAILSWMADYLFGYRGTSNIIPFWLLVWIGILLYIIKKNTALSPSCRTSSAGTSPKISRKGSSSLIRPLR